MSILRGHTLQRQITVATSMLLLAVSAAAIWSGNRTRMERQQELQAEATSVAALAAAYLTQYFDGLDATAAALAEHPAIVNFEEPQATHLFAALIADQPLLLNVALRDRTGALRASGVNATGVRDSPPPEHVLRTLQTGQPSMGSLAAAPVTGKPTIGRAYPVRDAGGGVVGVLAFGLNLIQLETIFQRLPLPPESVVMLQDQQGRVLARSRDSEKYIGTTEPLPGDDSLWRKDPDGVERFMGTAIVARGPWTLCVGIPRGVVVARLLPLFTRNIVILGGAVLAALGLALWLSRHISSRLNHLRLVADRIAQGDFTAPARMSAPSLEIEQLQSSFTSMAAGLREARSALAQQVEQERQTREVLQSIQRQLVRQERLAAVGVLASGVAHELNNPLQAILGTAEILERHPVLKNDAQEEITLLKTQSGRARDIIRNLSRFASPQSEPPSFVDLGSIIAEVVQLRGRELEKASIALQIEVLTGRRVYANATELEQVTLNFVINAQQSIESTGRGRGRVLIRLCEDGPKVRLEVHDDGPGVKPEDEPKLFQPFFTTKPVGKGTGLGLSVSYGIIDSYGGTIGYRASDWRGAVFYFEMPAAEEAEASLVTSR